MCFRELLQLEPHCTPAGICGWVGSSKHQPSDFLRLLEGISYHDREISWCLHDLSLTSIAHCTYPSR